MIINEKQMLHLYLNRGFSTCRLAKKFNCDSKTVWKRLKKLNVPLRTKSEAQTKHKINYKQLKEFYLNQKLSTKQIADKFGCWPSTILAKLAKFGIKRRKWYEGVRLRDDRFKKIALANIKYTKKDLWRVRITSRENLKKFIFLIKPYLKHKKRKKDILNAAKHL